MQNARLTQTVRGAASSCVAIAGFLGVRVSAAQPANDPEQRSPASDPRVITVPSPTPAELARIEEDADARRFDLLDRKRRKTRAVFELGTTIGDYIDHRNKAGVRMAMGTGMGPPGFGIHLAGGARYGAIPWLELQGMAVLRLNYPAQLNVGDALGPKCPGSGRLGPGTEYTGTTAQYLTGDFGARLRPFIDAGVLVELSGRLGVVHAATAGTYRSSCFDSTTEVELVIEDDAWMPVVGWLAGVAVRFGSNELIEFGVRLGETHHRHSSWSPRQASYFEGTLYFAVALP